MPRPTIDEELATEIRRIHRETHKGESAGSLQEALDTVVQLALNSASSQPEQPEESNGWYPGKYAGMIVNRVAGDASTTTTQDRTPASLSESSRSPPHGVTPSPDQTAIFKTRLNNDQTITIPETEINALSIETNDILQIYAYPINDI